VPKTANAESSENSPRDSPNKLQECFRHITGFNDPKPKGLYEKVDSKRKTTRRDYIYSSYLISVLMGLQIVVAAALTALGASNAPHVVVTVLGAINTAIAGLLAYMKSSGLPNRPRFFHTKWRELKDHIEHWDRSLGDKDFCQIDGHKKEDNCCSKRAHEEAHKIESWYYQVKADVDAITVEGHPSETKVKGTSVTKDKATSVAKDKATSDMSGTKDEGKS